MPESPTIRVVIADDHPIFRTGLRHLLEAVPGFTVMAEAADARQAVEAVRQHQPDVLLLDIVMPGTSGLDVLPELSHSSTTRVVLLTAAIDAQESLRALRLGAAGILLKTSALTDVVRCAHTVVSGRYWVGGEAFQSLVGSLARGPAPAQETPPRAFGLTARELEVVSLVATGAANRDIATQLGLSEETVKHHLSKIFDKTGQSSRVELALFALQTGLASHNG